MVVATPTPIRSEKIREVELPIIDLSAERSEVSKLIVKACEELGFFKVINHGVPEDVIARMEEESFLFFSKPGSEKQRAGPANPYGYGSKNIGFNGDTGEVEYLILNTNFLSISQRSKAISNDPIKFSCAVRDYVEAVRIVACEILELMAEGLWVPDTSVFSKLIRDIGFGGHSDPQLLAILRSNDVSGLQISPKQGLWLPVSPYPTTAFCVNVGDLLQAMTNGRFVSVKHRALASSYKSRMSMAYFGAPKLHARITTPPELVTQFRPCLYRPFTWAEYKETTYSLRLSDSRLNLFKVQEGDEIV
ncbi:Gibberellin 2-beta-dioxygenase 2 [Camellia lanceoleosa]|uniref:Gibberellin 2-beta-dioxygenase 2 n=1 Tax=Camellia lanceoleosa TaxID=1840588 RepID=A0ACC0HEY1_9ERIC|nr:Gibberellin 2-beta-dioxygenase 2 [Camellia lanceoleosa]